MFNSPVRPAVASNTTTSTFKSTPSTNPHLFVFGAGTGTQNPSTVSPFGNLPTNNVGTIPFGQPTNVFPTNVAGTNVKSNPVSGQAPFSVPPTATNIFGVNNNATPTPNPFSTVTSITSGTPRTLFNQPLPTAPQATPNLFTPGTNIFGPTSATAANPFSPATSTMPVTAPKLFAPGTNIFGPASATVANPFSPATSTVPVTAPKLFTTATNIFGTPVTTAANPYIIPTPTAQPASNNTANTNASALLKFGGQPLTNTHPFPQPATSLPFSNTGPVATTDLFKSPVPPSTNPPVFPGFNQTVSNSGPPNFSPVPAASTTTTFSTASNLGIQPPVPKTAQNAEQTASINQQNFLAASLLDPYANRGRKDFTNADLFQPPVDPTAASTPSTTAAITTVTTSVPLTITLPFPSNLRKASPSRSLVDVNFKLKPVSTSPTPNNDLEPSNQKSMVSVGAVKSTLSGKFTDEEELVLLGQTKMSRLRLSDDIPNTSSPSNPLRSLYPVRHLTELEKLTNITSRPSSSPTTTTTTTTVNQEQTPRPSSNSRDVSPNHRLTPPIIPKQSPSPIIQRKSNDNDSRSYRLPILTRDNYYMKPTQSELRSLFNDRGHCILKQFTVGHEKYGSVTFYGQMNVAGLDLDEIIQINHHEVTVYPDDDHKPAVGEGLNLPARITLLGVYPIDRTTREEITDVERIKAANYNDYLREITKKFDGEFINYGMTDGSWTFTVKHFTRYGLDHDEEDLAAEL